VKAITEATRARRNLRPHRPAVAAMWLWAERYSKQRGGSMDFWYSLSKSEKDLARSMATGICAAPPEGHE